MGHPGIYKMEQAPKKKEHVGVKKRAFSSGHGSKFRGANFCKRWTLLGALWVFVNKKLVHHVRLWQLSAQNLVPYVTSGRTLNALNASWPQWHQKHTAFEDRFTLPFLITWTFMYQMGNSTYTHISNVKSTLVSIHDVQHMYIYNMPASFGYAHTRTYIPIFCLILARKEVPWGPYHIMIYHHHSLR
jgi:hypothetical protein